MNWSIWGLLLMLALPAEYETRINASREAFFRQDFQVAATRATAARKLFPDDPESYEAHTSALLFRLRKQAGVNGSGLLLSKQAPDPSTLAEFLRLQAEGVRQAERCLRDSPRNARCEFLLAKLHLNKLWLNLQVLDRKTGLGEYRSARAGLERVLVRDPNHARALTALGWIEQVVAERSWAVRRLLGGGSHDKALAHIHRATSCSSCSELDVAEAKFALAELLQREKRQKEAEPILRELRRRFPPQNGNGDKVR